MKSQELDRLIGVKSAAEKEMNGLNAEIFLLQEKLDNIEENFPRLQRAAEAALKAKDKALADFAADMLSETELKLIRATNENTKKEEAESIELTEAIARRINQSIKRVPGLSQNLVTANKKVWRHIMDGLTEQIRQAAGDLPVKAYAAAVGCGAEVFNAFIHTVFVTPLPDAVKAAQKLLEQEYFGEPTLNKQK